MSMPAIHRDFIVACRLRKQTLRNLQRAVREAEENARRWPHLRSTARALAFHEDQLADFMYRNCGFPKGLPAPEKKWHLPSAAEAQRDFNDVIMSIPLGGDKSEPRA